MTCAVFRVEASTAKPWRVIRDGCTLSANFRTRDEAVSAILRAQRYERASSADLSARLVDARAAEVRHLHLELRSRADLAKFRHAQSGEHHG